MGRRKDIFILFLMTILVIVITDMRSNIMDRISNAGNWELSRINELDEYNSEEWDMELETFGVISIDYKEEELKENVEVHLLFFYDKEDVNITTNVGLTDNVFMNIEIYYDYTEKKLVYEPIRIVDISDEYGIEYIDKDSVYKLMNECNVSEEDIREYQEYALFDVVVRTWVEANGGIYWLEKWKLERCIVDNTFNFEK